MGAGMYDSAETEDQGNRMADAIEKFIEEMNKDDFIVVGNGNHFHRLVSELDDAANNWRTHGGQEEF